MADTTTLAEDRMYFQRLAARLFVLAGVAFWTIAAFAAERAYRDLTIGESLTTAALPFFIGMALLGVGWYFERIAAGLLMLGAAGVVVWGVLGAWEIGVWVLMGMVLFAPMVIAAVLFMLAARNERRGTEPVEALQPSRLLAGQRTAA